MDELKQTLAGWQIAAAREIDTDDRGNKALVSDVFDAESNQVAQLAWNSTGVEGVLWSHPYKKVVGRTAHEVMVLLKGLWVMKQLGELRMETGVITWAKGTL